MKEKGKINRSLVIIVLALILFFSLLFFAMWALDLEETSNERGDNQGEIVSNYPDAFNLKNNEVPEGFKLEKLSKSKMNRIGLKTNPGFIYSSEYVRYIYSGINPKSVDKVYTQRYQKGDSDDNLGIIAIKYNTVDDLKKEEKKIEEEGTGRKTYLKKGNVMVIVWCDKYEDTGSINNISTSLRDRLGLTRLDN